MKSTVKLIGFIIPFGLCIAIAVLSILSATGLINYDGNDVWAAFFRNVGYSIFAGVIVIAIIELYKTIENTANRDH